MPYLDDILPELGDDEFDPAKHLKEVMADEQPGGGDTFALEACEAALVYVLDWRKRRSFVRWMLGFCYADRADPYRLRRENPQPHPAAPWLTAISIHFAAVAPKANTDSGVPDTTAEGYEHGVPNFPSVYASDGIKRAGYYDSCWATVRFTFQPWTFRPDTHVHGPADELKRNCYFDPAPSVDLLQAEGGTAQLLWNQTSPAAPGVTAGPPIDPRNNVIGNQFATQVAKCVFTLNWMWVAESYLSNDPLMFFPTRVISRNSYVNSKPFAGRPAGSMLMLAPQFQRFRFPVGVLGEFTPFYGWNVRIPFVYFDPPRGVPRDAAAYATQALEDAVDAIPRGHRLLPWRANGRFYQAVREDKKTHMLQEADLNDVFRHVDDPA